MAKKTTCPITRAQFRAKAKPLKIVVDGRELVDPAVAKEFSTGSLGWYLNAKITIDVDGVPVPVQIGANFTIVGSKELPPDESAPPQAAPESAPAEEG